jgi:hypothetical protein
MKSNPSLEKEEEYLQVCLHSLMAYRSSADIARLKLFFDKTKAPDLGKFLFTYTKKQLERFPENESIAFYVAAAAELHLGKDAALVFYKKYNTKFPSGNYSVYIKNKID